MWDTSDIGLVVVVEQLEHLAPVEQLALVAMVDVPAQSSSSEVQRQLMHQPTVAEHPVANIQMQDLTAVVYLKKKNTTTISIKF